MKDTFISSFKLYSNIHVEVNYKYTVMSVYNKLLKYKQVPIH